MRFKTLEIQNFMSIRSAKIELDNQGLVLIKGVNNSNPTFKSNGAGKSTIAESIVYVLFGRTMRGLKGDEIVNNVSGSNCKVVLDLVDDNGDEYRLARYRHHKQQKNSVFLYHNGKDVTPKSDADFNKAIVSLLQTDFMTFTSSILYSAESFKFTQATDAELKSAFDVMLDLKVWSDALDEVKSSIKAIDIQVSAITSKLNDLGVQKQSLYDSKTSVERKSDEFLSTQKNKIKAITESIIGMKQELEIVQSERSELLKQKQDISNSIAESSKQVQDTSKIDSAISELRSAISDSEDEKSETSSKKRKLMSKIRTIKGDIDELESESNKLKRKLDSSSSKIDELKSTIGSPCPVCGKPLDESHVAEAIVECERVISESRLQISKNDDLIKSMRDDIESIAKEIESLDSTLSDIDGDISHYNELLSKAQKRLKKAQSSQLSVIALEKKLVAVDKDLSKHDVTIDSISQKIQLYTEQIEQLESAENPWIGQSKEYDDRIQKLSDEENSLQSELGTVNNELELLQFWLKGFSNSGIKSMLLDDITPFLNKRANKYLKILSGGRLSVNFSTQTKLKNGDMREKFQIELNNLDGGNNYLSNSSGERRRVDVAVNLALCDLISSRANKKINMVFADEIFDSLDDTGIESVMALLRVMVKEKSSIFVISHNEQIQQYFDKVLTVVKDGESSSVSFEG